MKKIVLAFAILTSSHAFAAQTLLRCNITSGDLQEVKVISQSSGLVLVELNSVGRTLQRALSNEEFQRGKITLSTRDVLTSGLLVRSGNDWMYEFKSSGWIDRGIADCR